MAELVHTNPEESHLFLERIGFRLPPHEIIQTFPGFFPERRIIHVKNHSGKESSRVLKIRPDDSAGRLEAEKFRLLIKNYHFNGAHFQDSKLTVLPASKYLVLDMPYLGIDLGRLAVDLDENEPNGVQLNGTIFHGFTESGINNLIDIIVKCQGNFASQVGLIHGDILQGESANNIVYNPSLKRLLFVDAEALTTANDESIDRFYENLGKVKEWIYRNFFIPISKRPQ